MNTVIIDYNAGNTQSVIFALQRLGVNPILSAEPEEIKHADKVIFPGVGEAKNTMKHLQSLHLDQLIPTLGQPILGICLGMQLLCKHSEEGDTPCLGIFDQVVKKFVPSKGEKVPHMGWNTIQDLKGPWFDPSLEHSFAYFVHSYYVPVSEHTVATTEYASSFSAAIQKDNFYAVQFHPEKSAEAGARVLERFLAL